jgi:hypothetical protein
MGYDKRDEDEDGPGEDPTDTDHPVGADQAADNQENDPPG